jgi:hypothetical protein
VSGAVSRVVAVSLLHVDARSIWTFSTGVGARANTGTQVALQSAFAIRSCWSQSLQSPAMDPGT